MSKSVSFFSSTLPTFDKDSGSNRLKEIIIAFLKLNYKCFFVVDTIENQQDYFSFFSEKGVVIITKEELTKEIEKIKTIDYIWFNGPNSFKKNLEITKNYFPNSKKIYDMVDIHFLRYKRTISLNPLRVSNYKRYFKYKKIETKLAQKADVIIAISETEKNIMKPFMKGSQIEVISNIHYAKTDFTKIPSFFQRKNLLFIGSQHTPNIDAIHFLYREILPIVWQHNPNICVDIIGNVKDKVKGIEHPNINFLGYVKDIESFFKYSKCMVAPLRYGAGVKGKIGQAFEYYLPVVTTSIGAEGMHLKDKETAIIKDNPTEFAKGIISLYEKEHLWNTISSNSNTVLERFSTDQINKTITAIEGF